jgi:hypothetical protein
MYERGARRAGGTVCLFRFLLGVALALLMVACGSGGGGSGFDGDDGGGGDSAATGSVVIRWQRSSDADGYVIHWGDQSGVYVHELDVGLPMGSDGVLSFVLDGVRTPATVFFALTSYDAAGAESGFSNELSTFVP